MITLDQLYFTIVSTMASLETTIGVAVSLFILCVVTPHIGAILLTLPVNSPPIQKSPSTMSSKDISESEMLQNV